MSQKIVSQLDAEGFFVAAIVADESPLEPGVYLIPGGAIDTPVPFVPERKRAKWAGEWVFEDIPQSDPEPEPELVPPLSMPASCTPWQIRKALNALGLRKQVEDAVAASEIIEVKDGWEFATVFMSDDPFVLGIGAAVGKTDAEIVEIIKYASTL